MVQEIFTCKELTGQKRIRSLLLRYREGSPFKISCTSKLIITHFFPKLLSRLHLIVSCKLDIFSTPGGRLTKSYYKPGKSPLLDSYYSTSYSIEYSNKVRKTKFTSCLRANNIIPNFNLHSSSGIQHYTS